MKSRFMMLGCGLLISIIVIAAQAQDTGSFTGTVTDPTGAIIPNAQVVIRNSARGIERTTSTNSDGVWVVPGLLPDQYDLTVSAPGFKKYQAIGIVLRVAQKSRVDTTLEVGASSTEVTVEGTTVAQVETQSSEMAGTVTGKEISQLQLNGRVFTQLVTLTPGISNQTGSSEGQYGITANVNYSVNGGRLEYNNWELDGGDNMDNGSNATLNVTPSIDAIGEVRVLTSNYGAQYGRNASGTIETETKSGSSSFHGDAYEFVRNNAFNAAPHFQSSVPSYKKNDWGYTIGGPIYIPNVYNTQKSKTFFFWSQEWRRDRVPGQEFNQPVPSVGERGGDFSDICPTAGTQFQRDDSTGAAGPYFPDCPAASLGPLVNQTQLYNTFANNQVPVDPNSGPLLGMIPLPSAGSANVYTAAPSNPPTGAKNWSVWIIISPTTCASCSAMSTTPGIRLPPLRYGPTPAVSPRFRPTLSARPQPWWPASPLPPRLRCSMNLSSVTPPITSF